MVTICYSMLMYKKRQNMNIKINRFTIKILKGVSDKEQDIRIKKIRQ